MTDQSKVSAENSAVRRVSVIVPKNPFTPPKLSDVKHCLCALDVEDLMAWWPGNPHAPKKNAQKVRDIQRSLDWKRVTQIAAYLLQEEIVGAPDKLDQVFSAVYEPTKYEPGRQWPPKVPKVVGYQRSEFPTFSNVLVHVNGAKVVPLEKNSEAAALEFDENDPNITFSVIDGQHRINGAYLAVRLKQIRSEEVKWEIPAEIFLDLDPPNTAPRRQAQIFIDVNFYQKKVDRSLVADLFPTARGGRSAMDDRERAQDIGRRLMLDVGPLVGLIQIPGVRFGAKDVVTLATLNASIESCLESMNEAGIQSIEAQSEFLAMCLEAWLNAVGRLEDPEEVRRAGLSAENVAYQGRVIVSVLTLVPAIILELRKTKLRFSSEAAAEHITEWLHTLAKRAGLLKNGKFIGKEEFKERRYLGAGGVALFRDVLWTAVGRARAISNLDDDEISAAAERNRRRVQHELHAITQ
jgi:DGQHR domain-containing protein